MQNQHIFSGLLPWGWWGERGPSTIFLQSLKRRLSPLSPPPPWKGGLLPWGHKAPPDEMELKKKNHVLTGLFYVFCTIFLSWSSFFLSSPFLPLHRPSPCPSGTHLKLLCAKSLWSTRCLHPPPKLKEWHRTHPWLQETQPPLEEPKNNNRILTKHLHK